MDLGQVNQRIVVVAIAAHFKMQVWAGGTSGGTDVTDALAAAYVVANTDGQPAHVTIQRHVAVGVADHNHIAIAQIAPAGRNDGTFISRDDRRAQWRADVNGWVRGIVVALGDRAPCRPDEAISSPRR